MSFVASASSACSSSACSSSSCSSSGAGAAPEHEARARAAAEVTRNGGSGRPPRAALGAASFAAALRGRAAREAAPGPGGTGRSSRGGSAREPSEPSDGIRGGGARAGAPARPHGGVGEATSPLAREAAEAGGASADERLRSTVEQGRDASDDGSGERRSGRSVVPPSDLDPLTRALLQPLAAGTSPSPSPSGVAGGAPGAPPSFDRLAEALVQRIAWSREGDGRGVVRLEIGRGRLAGAVVLLRAEGRDVEVDGEGLEPEALEGLRAAVRRRLAGRG